MKAILHTRCGCSQEIEIPRPPNPYYLLPLKRKPIGFWADNRFDITASSLGVRRFDLTKDFGTYATYVETEV
jgi:hypothetical protein